MRFSFVSIVRTSGRIRFDSLILPPLPDAFLFRSIPGWHFVYPGSWLQTLQVCWVSELRPGTSSLSEESAVHCVSYSASVSGVPWQTD